MTLVVILSGVIVCDIFYTFFNRHLEKLIRKFPSHVEILYESPETEQNAT